MCFASTPKAPQAPILPPAPPPQPTAQDPAIVKARQSTRQRARAAAGRTSTILTSGQGLLTQASTAKKTLLGV